MRPIGVIGPIVAACLLAGCSAVGPNFESPKSNAPSSWWSRLAGPGKQTKSALAVEPVDPNWWNLFNDPVLTGLEKRVADSNLDLRAAEFRMGESRAQLGIANAAQLPGLNANSSYTRQKASNTGQFGLNANALGANGASGSSHSVSI